MAAWAGSHTSESDAGGQAGAAAIFLPVKVVGEADEANKFSFVASSSSPSFPSMSNRFTSSLQVGDTLLVDLSGSTDRLGQTFAADDQGTNSVICTVTSLSYLEPSAEESSSSSLYMAIDDDDDDAAGEQQYLICDG